MGERGGGRESRPLSVNTRDARPTELVLFAGLLLDGVGFVCWFVA